VAQATYTERYEDSDTTGTAVFAVPAGSDPRNVPRFVVADRDDGDGNWWIAYVDYLNDEQRSPLGPFSSRSTALAVAREAAARQAELGEDQSDGS
jgi:hypothetical protein